MPTTSNFGWTTPADTDLVKDGASAIRTLGNGIDTSFVDLKGGTTGQILSKASNSDLDFSWTAAVTGDITAVTAGTGISGGGTSGDVTITNSMATAIDAKGDLIAGTGADAFSRLAVGTNGQYLVADSTAATGLKWQTLATGGNNWVLISSQSASAASSLSFTSLTGYKFLYLISNQFHSDVSNRTMTVRFNADSGSNYRYNGINLADRTRNSGGLAASAITNFYTGTNTDNRSSLSIFIDGTNGGGYKRYSLVATGYSTSQQAWTGDGIYIGTSNITSIDLTISAGSFTGDFNLYGVA